MLVPQQDAAQVDLASMLDAMTAEGAVSSTGVFTIDVRAALPKLEKFQLPRPHFGLLKVIQSAVASGATFVNTDFGSTGITIEHDGHPPDPEQLRDLLRYLLASDQSTGDRALRDLAIGVNTSLARGASWVEVSAKGEQGWASQRWVSREETTHVQEPQRADYGKASVRFVVRRTLGQAASEVLRWAGKDVGGLLFGSRDVLDEDARAVYDRCRHTPIEVRLNGKPVPPSSIGRSVVRRWSPFRLVEHRKPHILEVYLQARADSPHLMTAPRSSQARHRFVMHGDFKAGTFRSSGKLKLVDPAQLLERRCFAIAGIRGRAQVPGEITVVKDGVDLTRLTPRVLSKGVSVLLTAEGLRLDLSQFRVVDSAQTRERVAWLGQTVAECSRQVLDNFSSIKWSSEERSHLEALSGTDPVVY